MKLLLAAGADLFAADNKGETPFSLGVRDGDDAIMQTLINASVTASIERGGTALCRAIADGNYERVRSLAMQNTENDDGETALHLAAKKDDDKILEACAPRDLHGKENCNPSGCGNDRAE